MRVLTEYQKGIQEWFKDPIMSPGEIDECLRAEEEQEEQGENDNWWLDVLAENLEAVNKWWQEGNNGMRD